MNEVSGKRELVRIIHDETIGARQTRNRIVVGYDQYAIIEGTSDTALMTGGFIGCCGIILRSGDRVLLTHAGPSSANLRERKRGLLDAIGILGGGIDSARIYHSDDGDESARVYEKFLRETWWRLQIVKQHISQGCAVYVEGEYWYYEMVEPKHWQTISIPRGTYRPVEDHRGALYHYGILTNRGGDASVAYYAQ